jgi:hypothetical protein
MLERLLEWNIWYIGPHRPRLEENLTERGELPDRPSLARPTGSP